MSPFMSSMPPPGLIEMPPVSKVTPLPTKASGLPSTPPPRQRITTTRDSWAEPLADAEEGPHPDRLERRKIEDLDLDAEARQLRRAAGEIRSGRERSAAR